MMGHAPGHLEDHAAYISDWANLVRESPRAFLAAGAKAQAAVDWLIERAGHPAGYDMTVRKSDVNAAMRTLGFEAGGRHAGL
jgi:antirestriction protein ArdC